MSPNSRADAIRLKAIAAVAAALVVGFIVVSWLLWAASTTTGSEATGASSSGEATTSEAPASTAASSERDLPAHGVDTESFGHLAVPRREPKPAPELEPVPVEGPSPNDALVTLGGDVEDSSPLVGPPE